MERVLTVKEFVAFAKGRRPFFLSGDEVQDVCESRKVLEEIIKSRSVYGVNTGIGALCGYKIKDDNLERFQKELILSHAAGVGRPMEKDITRGAFFLLLNTLKKGYSGICLETLNFLIEMFNRELIPIVPEIGSLGASGDLIPLAHLALPLLGKGWIWPRCGHDNIFDSCRDLSFLVFKKEGMKLPRLQAGEAISLINGTHFSASILALLAHEAADLCDIADLAASMSMRALCGNADHFGEEITGMKKHSGQTAVAHNLAEMTGVLPKGPVLQDGYSLRCVPQVHGAVRDAVRCATNTVTGEINSVSSNPVIFREKKEIHSGGNFHGQPLALAADSLAIALSSLADISERRIERLLNPALSGLPPFLSSEPGVDSGLMLVQYTAVALNARNKVLAHPASVGSVSVSASQEDFVSLAATAALKAREILRNVQYVLAIEIFCASRAMDLRGDAAADGSMAAKTHRVLRRYFSGLKKDEPLSRDLKEVFELIKNGRLTAGLK